jgi:hypothetical protein
MRASQRNLSDQVDAHCATYGATDELTGQGFLGACSELQLEQQLIRAAVQKADAEGHGCGYLGFAVAHFRLERARAIPTDVEFVPNQQ